MSYTLVIALGVLAAGAPKEALPDGNWQAVSMVVNAFQSPEGEVKATRLVIEKGAFRQEFAGRLMRSGTVAFETTRTPHLIDFSFTGDDGKPETMAGVYELAGDRLTVCVARPGVPRAETLEARPDSGCIRTVYERIKP